MIVKREREEPSDDQKVDEPSGTPPDEGKAFDPEMTEADEANIPPESDADPEGEPGRGRG